MSVTLLDGLIVVIVLLSAVLAMIRGFVREVLSIASWVAAAIAAYAFYEQLLPFTRQYVSNEHIALGLTIAAIFFVTLIIVSIITMKVSDFVIDSKIGLLDRTLGFVFGAARGLLLVVVAMLFFNWLVPIAQQPTWVANAKSKPMLDDLGTKLIAVLPAGPDAAILEKIRPGTPEPVTPQTGPVPRTEGSTGGPAPGAANQAPDANYGTGARQGLNQLIQSGGGQQGGAPASGQQTGNEAPGGAAPQ